MASASKTIHPEFNAAFIERRMREHQEQQQQEFRRLCEEICNEVENTYCKPRVRPSNLTTKERSRGTSLKHCTAPTSSVLTDCHWTCA